MSRGHGLIRFGVLAGGLVSFLASALARAQDPLENAPMAPQSTAKGDTTDGGRSGSDSRSAGTAAPTPKPEFIRLTHVQWRGLLSKLQYAVTREKATEPPFTGKYASGHFKGTFVCVCCDAARVQSELFSSQTKFDSGTGWPSFYQAVSDRAVTTAWDYSGLEPRLEVNCRRCGAHLGHVFDDGPPPTGLRFCINSAAIKLNTPEVAAGKKHPVDTTSAKSKSKAKSKTVAKTAPTVPTPGETASPAPADRVPPAQETKAAPASSSP